MPVSNEGEQLRAVVDNVIDGIIVIDGQGTIESVNAAAEKLFNYSASHLLGRNVCLLMPEPFQSQHDSYLQNYLETGNAKIVGIGREVSGMRSDGSTFPLELAVGQMEIDGKTKFTGIVRDISARKAAEATLRDREQLLTAILTSVVDGIITIDEQGRIETINPAGLSIFGYSEEELQGENVNKLMPEPFKAEHDGYLINYLETREPKIIGIGREVIGLRKGGGEFPMDLAVSEIEIDGKRKFTGIVRDITDRKQAEQSKSEFVSTVSHELRTPLTSIKGSIGLLRAGLAGELPTQFDSMIEIANNNCDRLIRLINDILDIEKLDAGKFTFRKQTEDLALIIKQSHEEIAGYASEHEVTVVCELEMERAIVWCDKDRIAQVLNNLLSNAIKFSSSDSSVKLTLRSAGTRFKVSIVDTGPGVPVEFHSKIFTKFTQADSSDTRKESGTGLGLYISKSIVDAHQGSIAFDSKPGRTEFYFELPMHQEDFVEDSIPNQQHIVICDDDFEFCSLVSSILTAARYRVSEAHSTSECLGILKRYNDVSMLLLDLQFPNEHGIDMLEKLRHDPEISDIPVIIVSAFLEEDLQKVTDDPTTSVVECIAKPINHSSLVQTVKEKLCATHLPRVLHVEQDPDILNFVSSLISSACEMYPARSLAQAVQLMDRHRFDLVILETETALADETAMLVQLLTNASGPPVLIFSTLDYEGPTSEPVVGSLLKSRTSNELLELAIREALSGSKGQNSTE